MRQPVELFNHRWRVRPHPPEGVGRDAKASWCVDALNTRKFAELRTLAAGSRGLFWSISPKANTSSPIRHPRGLHGDPRSSRRRCGRTWSTLRRALSAHRRVLREAPLSGIHWLWRRCRTGLRFRAGLGIALGSRPRHLRTYAHLSRATFVRLQQRWTQIHPDGRFRGVRRRFRCPHCCWYRRDIGRSGKIDEQEPCLVQIRARKVEPSQCREEEDVFIEVGTGQISSSGIGRAEDPSRQVRN